MAGICFLAAALFVGGRISGILFAGAKNRPVPFWLHLAASFGFGVLTMGWLVYFLAWGIYALTDTRSPLLYANFAVICPAAVWALVCAVRTKGEKKARIQRTGGISLIPPEKAELILYGILLGFLTWIFFYVFHVSDHLLYSGATVFSDYAPHTAIIRSFSRMNNYPTQYPHFGGQDIRYHFMFQFLTGNLEYLGMRIDIAYNVVSIISLELFLIVLTQLARLFGAGIRGMTLTVIFFLLRSGTAFFRFLGEHLAQGDLLRTLEDNTSFPGYTTNESWGFWNFNVYLNQRHLAFGLLIGSLAVWYLADRITVGKGYSPRTLFASRQAWGFSDLTGALILGTMLGLTGFWNGAAVIGCLLILAVFGVCSMAKADYLVLAGCAVFFSWLQTKIFITGSAVSPAFHFGFLADQPTIPGAVVYLAEISGFAVLGAAVIWIFFPPAGRVMIAAFVLPVVFAFTVSLTVDIGVNHKYIMICFAFMAPVWGAFVDRLFLWKPAGVCLGVILVICLTATGAYDFAMIVRGNDGSRRYGVDPDSELTRWLDENLDETDLILTPLYSMSETTLAGCMLYNGWPYYAWSAGYDTWYRGDVQQELYSTQDPGRLLALTAEEGITYILYEEGMTLDGKPCREDIISSTFPLVFDNGYIRVYQSL